MRKNRTALLALATSTLMAGCATLGGFGNSNAPEGFDPGAETAIETEEAFVTEVVGKPLELVKPGVEADLMFKEDNTAVGMLVRIGEEGEEMALDWTWEDGAYCRTGTVGELELERQCESVHLIPDVGVRLSYTTTDEPDEYWEFR